jgi:hypothetical protein
VKQLTDLRTDWQKSVWAPRAEYLGGTVHRDGLKCLKDRRQALAEVMSIVSRQRTSWPSKGSEGPPQPSHPDRQHALSSRLPYEELRNLALQSGYAFQDLLWDCGLECRSGKRYRFSDIGRALGTDDRRTTSQHVTNFVNQNSKAGRYDEEEMRVLRRFYQYLEASMKQEEAEDKASKKESSLVRRAMKRVGEFWDKTSSSKTEE